MSCVGASHPHPVQFKFQSYKKAKKIGETRSEVAYRETHIATQALGSTPIA